MAEQLNLIVTELVVQVDKSERDRTQGIVSDARRSAREQLEALYGPVKITGPERVDAGSATFRVQITGQPTEDCGGYEADRLSIARADRALRERLEQITDPALRAECLRAFEAVKTIA